MSDEQLIDVIAAVCGFDREGVERWHTEALIIGRAVQRASRRSALMEVEAYLHGRQMYATANAIRAIAASDSDGGKDE
jgi:hypothetical protein